jgi:hypothetical protein
VAGRAAWPRAAPGPPSPPKAPAVGVLYCGPDPSWPAAKEGQPRSTCTVCGGLRKAEDGSLVSRRARDPIPAGESAVVICAGCSRAHARHEGRLAGSLHAADPKRLGKVAEKVRGRPDPQLNPYVRLLLAARAVARRTAKAGRRPPPRPE